jgi:hypothetical protein
MRNAHEFTQIPSFSNKERSALRVLTKLEPAPMTFERVLASDKYSGFRMTYRGKGGWSWPLKSGKLSDIAEKLIKNIGTEGFFELF